FVHQQPGSFRAWLKTVTLNRWRENCRKAAGRRETGGPMPDLAATRESELFWEEEYRQHLIGQALKGMQTDFEPRTWQACWLLVVEGRTAPQVATQLGMSVGTVYAAKFRVLARLRQELLGLLD